MYRSGHCERFTLWLQFPSAAATDALQCSCSYFENSARLYCRQCCLLCCMDSTDNTVTSCCSYKCFLSLVPTLGQKAGSFLLYTFYTVQWPTLIANYLLAKNRSHKVLSCVLYTLRLCLWKAETGVCTTSGVIIMERAKSVSLSSCLYSCPCVTPWWDMGGVEV